MIQKSKQINPLLKTRYLVVLPEELNIEPFQISKIKLPILELNTRNKLIPWAVYSHSDYELEILNTLENSPSKKLLDFMKSGKKIEVRVEILDGIGLVITEYKIIGVINSINFNEFEYGSNETFKTNVKISVNSFTIN